MKVLNYNTDNFWQLLDDHLSLIELKTSSKIDDEVKSIIEDVKRYGDEKIIKFAKDFDRISLSKNEIRLSNLNSYYSLDYLKKDTIESFRVAIKNINMTIRRK